MHFDHRQIGRSNIVQRDARSPQPALIRNTGTTLPFHDAYEVHITVESVNASTKSTGTSPTHAGAFAPNVYPSILPSSHTHLPRFPNQNKSLKSTSPQQRAMRRSLLKMDRQKCFVLFWEPRFAYPRVCMAGCSNSRSRCRFTLFGSPSVSIHPKVEGPIRYSNPHVYRPERHHHASSAHISIKCRTPSSSDFA